MYGIYIRDTFTRAITLQAVQGGQPGAVQRGQRVRGAAPLERVATNGIWAPRCPLGDLGFGTDATEPGRIILKSDRSRNLNIP